MSTRIKGVALMLEVGTPAVEYKADVTACTLTNEEQDADVVTFADVAAGETRQFYLNLTGVQSTDTASLWSYIWDNTGEEVAFTYAPHGNAVATAAHPHFVGMVKIGPPPELGGEAGADNTFTFESQWEVIGTPTKDIGA